MKFFQQVANAIAFASTSFALLVLAGLMLFPETALRLLEGNNQDDDEKRIAIFAQGAFLLAVMSSVLFFLTR